MKLVVSDGAKADLKSISDYTMREWGARQRTRYLHLLRAAFKRLRRNPASGVARDDIARHYRSLPVESHVIYFRIFTNRVEIVRILHGRMDAERHIEDQNVID